jgi:hypothetical protein
MPGGLRKFTRYFDPQKYPQLLTISVVAFCIYSVNPQSSKKKDNTRNP